MKRAESQRREHPSTASQRPVILVVDDDPDFRALIRAAVDRSGSDVDVCECRSGLDALALLRHVSIDPAASLPALVMLDLDMPDMDGRALLAAMRADASLRTVPVVILTGVDDDDEERRALSSGANSYACKGCGGTLMLDSIAQIARYWTTVHRPIRSTSAAA